MTVFEQNRALLEAFRQGEAFALEIVYRRYVNDVVRFVQNKLGRGAWDFELQGDVIQEIFIRAFGQSARLAFDGVRPYKPFLLSISRNIIIDFIRKQGRDPIQLPSSEEAFTASIAAASADSGDDRERDVHWDRCIEASRKYLEGLDPLAREFVRLRFREEMPQLEVSAALKITRWKVRSLEKRVQQGLSRYLKRRKLAD